MTASFDNKLYIHVIDGADAWVAVNARPLGDNRYEILTDENYDDSDASELWEFLPGDIVVGAPRTFKNRTIELSALTLVTPSDRADRKYWEFMFLATTGRLRIDIETYNLYETEINRIRATDGQFLYPTVLTTIRKLRKLKRAASDKA